jgi:hypothetical protein
MQRAYDPLFTIRMHFGVWCDACADAVRNFLQEHQAGRGRFELMSGHLMHACLRWGKMMLTTWRCYSGGCAACSYCEQSSAEPRFPLQAYLRGLDGPRRFARVNGLAATML